MKFENKKLLLFAEIRNLKFVIRNWFFIISFLPIVLSAACGNQNSPAVNKTSADKTNALRNMNQSNAADLEIKTDIADLEKKINLPVRPSAVQWAEEIFDNSKGAIAAPSDRRITVLLKYDAQSAVELTKKITPEISDSSLGNQEVKEWFPDEIKKQAQTKNGKTFLEGVHFPVDAFKRPPYNNGKMIRVGESDYFLLHLFSF